MFWSKKQHFAISQSLLLLKKRSKRCYFYPNVASFNILQSPIGSTTSPQEKKMEKRKYITAIQCKNVIFLVAQGGAL
jgi:hypothetical protein